MLLQKGGLPPFFVGGIPSVEITFYIVLFSLWAITIYMMSRLIGLPSM